MTTNEKTKVAMLVPTAQDAEVRGAALQKLASENDLLELVFASMEQEPVSYTHLTLPTTPYV